MPKKRASLPKGAGKRLKEFRLKQGLNQASFAKILKISQSALSLVERDEAPVPFEALYALALKHDDLDLRRIVCGKPTSLVVDAGEVASCVRPVIRALGDGLADLPPDGVADDYLAVPLLDGRVAAGPGGVIWERVKSLVWLYRPEVGGRRKLVAVRVAGNSMEPTIPDGAIIIIDKSSWAPKGQRKHIWAIRTEDGDTQIKRLHRVNGGFLIMSDNVAEYPPEPAWTTDIKQLVIGQVIWMWRSLY